MFSWTYAQLGIREPVARSSPKTIAACLLMPCSAVSVWNSLGFQSCGSAWLVPHTRACVPWQSLEDSLMVIGSHPHSVPVALSASWRLVWRASFTASSQVTLLAEVLKGCRASVLRQSWGAWAGSAVLSKVQVTPIEQIRWPKKPWVQRLDCCPDQGLNKHAGTCSQHLAIFRKPHTVPLARLGPGHCPVTRVQRPCPQHRSVLPHTQRRVGTKTETFRFYWAYFLFRNEGQFSHFWAILLSVLQNCM